MERKVPSVLWIGLAALGAMTLIQLSLGLRSGSEVLLLAVVGNIVVGAGLVLGHKWAYVVTLVLAVAGPIVLLGTDPRRAGPCRGIELTRPMVPATMGEEGRY